MHDAWSELTSWSETCERSSGRRGYNKRRQLVAALRRQVIAKHLRQAGLRRGIQAELSRMLQVSKSTVSQDVRRLLARSEERSLPAWQVGKRYQTAAGRRGRRREVRMPEKISLRLSTRLSDDLQHEARSRGVSASAIVRLALQRVLDQSIPASAPSALPPNDTLEWWVMTFPPEVQTAIRQTVAATELPLGSVLKALIITACQPKTTP